MKQNDSSFSIVRKTIQKALGHFPAGAESETITDIHLQVLQATGNLNIFDDDDRELAHVVIDEWASNENDDFDEQVQSLLISVLHDLKDKGALEQVSIMKPYSFVQIDENKESVGELLLMDDDTLLVNDELLKGLDDDLNAFLKDLLEK